MDRDLVCGPDVLGRNRGRGAQFAGSGDAQGGQVADSDAAQSPKEFVPHHHHHHLRLKQPHPLLRQLSLSQLQSFPPWPDEFQHQSSI